MLSCPKQLKIKYYEKAKLIPHSDYFRNPFLISIYALLFKD